MQMTWTEQLALCDLNEQVWGPDLSALRSYGGRGCHSCQLMSKRSWERKDAVFKCIFAVARRRSSSVMFWPRREEDQAVTCRDQGLRSLALCLARPETFTIVWNNMLFGIPYN